MYIKKQRIFVFFYEHENIMDRNVMVFFFVSLSWKEKLFCLGSESLVFDFVSSFFFVRICSKNSMSMWSSHVCIFTLQPYFIL